MSIHYSPNNGGPPTPVRNAKARRLAVELSQERLARAADCSIATIRLIERGAAPSARMAARVEAALVAAEAARAEA